MKYLTELLYGNTRCYLLKNKLLIDTSWAGTLPDFLKCINQNHIHLEEIQYLMMTHFHPDHMGIAQDIADLGIKLIVFNEQAKYLHSFDNVYTKRNQRNFHPINDSEIKLLSCKNSRHFLESLGIQGEVIYTPGHSNDSVSVIMDDGETIVGDLLPIHLAPIYNDKIIEHSWNNILSHNIHVIYYGHAQKDTILNIHCIDDVK
jgi:glyoxylase-like metal-dependent hydrolase (beta-lactamase superfamily II)